MRPCSKVRWTGSPCRRGRSSRPGPIVATEGDLGYGVVVTWLRSPDIRVGLDRLVADDCQWSDHVSQEFIHYLIRQRVDVPLLVVLTARREELEVDHPMTALRDAVAVLDRVTELPLERLSRDATGEIGSQLAGSRLDDEAERAANSPTSGLYVVVQACTIRPCRQCPPVKHEPLCRRSWTACSPARR